MMKFDTTKSNAKASMLNRVSIVSVCFTVVVFAILVHLKKKNVLIVKKYFVFAHYYFHVIKFRSRHSNYP